MAFGFVALDALTIILGFLTDVICPLTNQMVPSIANICTAIFGAGYFLIIIRFDLFNVRLVVSDRDVIEHSMEALLVVDELGEILDVNNAACHLLESERDNIIGGRIDSLFPNGMYASLIDERLRATDSVNGVEIPLKLSVDDEKQLVVSGSVIRNRKQEYTGTVLSLRNITQLNRLKELYKNQSEQYQRLAFVDTLTGLPNRRRTFEYLRVCEKQFNITGDDFFIFYMDLDDFKSVNDKYGHNVGDRFLKEVALRLKSCISDDLSFLGRLSGDEFLIAGTASEKNDDTVGLIALLKDKFRTAFVIDDIRIQSGISVGYARYSDYKNIDNMVHHADEAMYEMKQSNKIAVGR